MSEMVCGVEGSSSACVSLMYRMDGDQSDGETKEVRECNV